MSLERYAGREIYPALSQAVLVLCWQLASETTPYLGHRYGFGIAPAGSVSALRSVWNRQSKTVLRDVDFRLQNLHHNYGLIAIDNANQLYHDDQFTDTVRSFLEGSILPFCTTNGIFMPYPHEADFIYYSEIGQSGPNAIAIGL